MGAAHGARRAPAQVGCGSSWAASPSAAGLLPADKRAAGRRHRPGPCCRGCCGLSALRRLPAELCCPEQRRDPGSVPLPGVRQRPGVRLGRAAALLSLGAPRAHGTPVRAGGTPAAIPGAVPQPRDSQQSPQAPPRHCPPTPAGEVSAWAPLARGCGWGKVGREGEKLLSLGFLCRGGEAGFDLRRYLNLAFMNKALGKSLVCQRRSASGLTIREG